jgi:hypothetical protein
MKIPDKVPEKGFYYHYKHDPAGSVNNYAYEFVDVGIHTEAAEDEADATMAIYRPLYKEAFVYTYGKFFDLRPLAMWMEDVTKDGKTFPRFSKITDPAVITELEAVKMEMYGE